MDIKKLNEQLDSILEAKEQPNFGGTCIDFDHVGCGIQIQTGTSDDGFITIILDGYSANNGKNTKFKSDIKVSYNLSSEERKENNDKAVEQKQLVKEALLKAAQDFDNKVAEIMKSFGFTNK